MDTNFEGVTIPDLLKQVQVKPEAQAVMAHCYGGYTANLLLDDFIRDENLLAYIYEDDPLPADHGGPCRLFVPHLYFWKSAKWVNGLEFIAKDEPGFWERYGYHMRGDPWKEERYS
jgi:DMSO/TMAO reductase YedYZ molybdopterin-dependent catalytic subunit